MKKLLTFCLLMSCSCIAFCQNESDNVKKTISTLFDAMRNGDTINFKNELAGKLIIYYVNPKTDTLGKVIVVNPSDYLRQIEAASGGHWDERITNYDDVNVSHDIAMVWASYKFYIGNKFDHCGIDVIQLVRTDNGWRVVSIFCTIKSGNCPD